MSVTPTAAFGAPEPAWVETGAGTALGATIRELGKSLVSPMESGELRLRLRGLLDPLRQAFAEHRAATEGERGIYADLVFDAPRLARTVDGLLAEHHRLDSAIAGLAVAADEVGVNADNLLREVIAVLDDLDRHRQSDARLVLEAYVTDIGGE